MIQVPVATAADVLITLPIAGALLYVMVVSPQVLSATWLAVTPVFRLLFA